MELIEQLSRKLTRLSNTDPAWVTFITDYINVIRDNSDYIAIEDSDRDKFKYKFDHYLREANVNQSIHWIAKLINNLTQYEDFTLLPAVWIPSKTFINQLYRLYQTSNQITA